MSDGVEDVRPSADEEEDPKAIIAVALNKAKEDPPKEEEEHQTVERSGGLLRRTSPRREKNRSTSAPITVQAPRLANEEDEGLQDNPINNEEAAVEERKECVTDENTRERAGSQTERGALEAPRSEFVKRKKGSWTMRQSPRRFSTAPSGTNPHTITPRVYTTRM